MTDWPLCRHFCWKCNCYCSLFLSMLSATRRHQTDWIHLPGSRRQIVLIWSSSPKETNYNLSPFLWNAAGQYWSPGDHEATVSAIPAEWTSGLPQPLPLTLVVNFTCSWSPLGLDRSMNFLEYRNPWVVQDNHFPYCLNSFVPFF